MCSPPECQLWGNMVDSQKRLHPWCGRIFCFEVNNICIPFVRRVAEEYAFNGFRVKFTALGIKIMGDKGCTSKYFQKNRCKDTIGWV